MSCSLEVWYFMALLLFAGYLKNAELAVDALSIRSVVLLLTVNISLLQHMLSELASAHPI
jgi:MATE family multidrug resistance protein